MYKRIAIGLALTLLVALPATAQDYKKGQAAAKSRDFATAFKEWQPLAVKGHTRAQHSLGRLYHRGRGVPLDYAEAAKWYFKAAKRGHINAKYLLGAMHAKGRGVKKDDVEAVKWYRQAANRGHAWAQLNLGRMYAKGRGVKKDPVIAQMWFNLSAASGLKFGARAQARAARHMPPAQVAKAQQLAGAWTANHKEERLARARLAKQRKEKLARARLEKEMKEKLALARLERQRSLGVSKGAPRGETSGEISATQVRLPAPDRASIIMSPLLAPKPAAAMVKAPPRTFKTKKMVAKTPAKAKDRSPASKTSSAIVAALPPAPARAALRVQLGAVQSKARAEKEAERLTRAHGSLLDGLKIVPVLADLGKRGVFYRLRAGPLGDHAQAGSLCRKLLDRQQDCIVIKP